MRKFFRDNGLAISMFGFFFLFVIGLSITGWMEENSTLVEHGQQTTGFVAYLFSGAFGEAIFENWESEFLQMGAYVALTALLVQRGSAESKPDVGRSPQDADSAQTPRRKRKNAPLPVRARGVWLRLYQHSLTIALALIFLFSFAMHAVTGAADYSEELMAHGEPGISVLGYITGSRFWFESFQNWQSEFLAVGALVVLSIFLRQRGSPESKPVDESNAKTGSD